MGFEWISWIVALKNHVRTSFKDVGKGWFNLDEQVQETYENGKLHKFLKMVKLMMEDSLRHLVEKNLERYTEFVEANCNIPVDVVDTNTATSTAPLVRCDQPGPSLQPFHILPRLAACVDTQ